MNRYTMIFIFILGFSSSQKKDYPSIILENVRHRKTVNILEYKNTYYSNYLDDFSLYRLVDFIYIEEDKSFHLKGLEADTIELEIKNDSLFYKEKNKFLNEVTGKFRLIYGKGKLEDKITGIKVYEKELDLTIQNGIFKEIKEFDGNYHSIENAKRFLEVYEKKFLRDKEVIIEEKNNIAEDYKNYVIILIIILIFVLLILYKKKVHRNK